jgi:hypothetical protein
MELVQPPPNKRLGAFPAVFVFASNAKEKPINEVAKFSEFQGIKVPAAAGR